MDRCVLDAPDESATAALGCALAALLPAGAVVALVGTLGAGKTRLAQAIARGEGVPEGRVTSPTFVLVQEHQGRRPVVHVDAYRLRDQDEFLQLGPEEFFEGEGITLVEWADRVADCLPTERLEVRIEVTGEQSRRFEVIAHGECYRPVVAGLRGRPGQCGGPS